MFSGRVHPWPGRSSGRRSALPGRGLESADAGQHFGDLHGVERRALPELIAGNEDVEAQTFGLREVTLLIENRKDLLPDDASGAQNRDVHASMIGVGLHAGIIGCE